MLAPGRPKAARQSPCSRPQHSVCGGPLCARTLEYPVPGLRSGGNTEAEAITERMFSLASRNSEWYTLVEQAASLPAAKGALSSSIRRRATSSATPERKSCALSQHCWPLKFRRGATVVGHRRAPFGSYLLACSRKSARPTADVVAMQRTASWRAACCPHGRRRPQARRSGVPDDGLVRQAPRGAKRLLAPGGRHHNAYFRRLGAAAGGDGGGRQDEPRADAVHQAPPGGWRPGGRALPRRAQARRARHRRRAPVPLRGRPRRGAMGRRGRHPQGLARTGTGRSSAR